MFPSRPGGSGLELIIEARKREIREIHEAMKAAKDADGGGGASAAAASSSSSSASSSSSSTSNGGGAGESGGGGGSGGGSSGAARPRGGEGGGEVTKKKVIKPPSSRDPKLIKDLLRLFKIMSDITAGVFDGHNKFTTSMRKALRHVVNLDLIVSKSAKEIPITQMLVAYIDNSLIKGKGSEASNLVVKECFDIMSYLDDKTLFEGYYRDLMCKRLLDRKLGPEFSNYECELIAISVLKGMEGASFVSKVEAMYKDFIAIKDEREKFSKHYKTTTEGAGALDFEVDIFTLTMWPPQPLLCVNLPPELSSRERIFEKYYIDQNSGRRLQWYHSRGEITMMAKWPGKGTQNTLMPATSNHTHTHTSF